MPKTNSPLGKQQVRRQAQRLRESVDWDPQRALGKRESAAEQWASLEQSDRQGNAYAKAAGCPDCVQAQAEIGDPTGLCEKHLQAAMGLEEAE